MESRRPFYILIVLLIVAGVSTSLYRHLEFNVPLLPGKQLDIWLIDAKVSFQGKGEAAEATLALPVDPAFQVLAENATSLGYGLTIRGKEDKRHAIWSVRDVKGPQQLYYKVTLISTEEDRLFVSEPPAVPSMVNWPKSMKLVAEQLVARAYNRSANNVSLARELNRILTHSSSDQNVALLLSSYSSDELFKMLLHTAKVPARIVKGLFLEDQRRSQTLIPFVEVYDEYEWHLFDPERGLEGRPDNLLLWERNGRSVLDVIGGHNSKVTFSMVQQTGSALATSVELMMNHEPMAFSLYQLPLEEQSLFKGILLIPVGVLVVVFLRIMIGVKTSGTFMPVLIALSFIQTTLLVGLIGFLLIVAFGLVIRSYLSHLHLLLVSRISAVVIVVIGIIVLFTLLSYKFGLSAGLTITFFPMIILAWTIERMSILWEEQGPKEVMIQGGGSLIVATLSYLAMSHDWVQHWVFNFLGIHLIILALVLLMGQYTGYRLLELIRFNPMKKE